jgi:hypothetical protein
LTTEAAQQKHFPHRTAGDEDYTRTAAHDPVDQRRNPGIGEGTITVNLKWGECSIVIEQKNARGR